ncbi:MAG TPA: hypothetical protein VKX25_16425 [Bryobacteraceae bacterium]|jgi:hypothetical protein|nr:hypothetical protein [Bryobacteraceae bacterium]
MRRRLKIGALCVTMAVQLGLAQAPQTDPPNLAADDLKQLRDRIAQQQEQIKKLQDAVAEQQKMLEASLAAQQKAAQQQQAAAHTADGTNVVAASTGANGQPSLVPAVGGMRPIIGGRGGQHDTTQVKSPLSISIGDTTFTPLGFVDATFFGRSTNVGSGIGTNFAGIPYNTAAAGHVSETNFSTQNSRIGFRVDSNVLGAKVLGYFEADFLGNQPTTVFVSSNSDTFRMRNVFVDVQKDGFEVLGGQDWSFMTPNRKGLSPLPSDIFYTQNMDTNYQAGLVWARQTQFRFIAHPTENFAFGVSLENPEQYIGGANGAGTITAPAKYLNFVGSSSVNGQFNNGSTNYGAPNLHPDIIFKGAYDGHLGEKLWHIEAAGLVRSFKYSAGTGTPVKYTTYSTTAGSGSVNANLEVFKNFRLIANTFFGSGNGRYMFAQAPDVVVRADGSIAPLHSYSTVDGFETNLTKNTVLSAYYGGIYIDRVQIQDTTVTPTPAKPVYVGYGYKGAPNSQNRAIQEGTIGITQTFWKNPSYGALSLITQYSYLTRNPWYLAIGAPRATHTNMYWIDLRYTLP